MSNLLIIKIFVANAVILHASAPVTRGLSPQGVTGNRYASSHAITDSLPPNDSSRLLTEDVLKRMTTFWRSFQKEPDSIRIEGQNANQEEVRLFSVNANTYGDKWVKKSVMNIGAMATRYPSVTADLARAGLTVDQWNDTRKALYKAIILGGMSYTKQAEAGDTSNVGKNIVFLASHTQQLDSLRVMGMWLPDPAQVENGLKEIVTRIMTAKAGGESPKDILLP